MAMLGRLVFVLPLERGPGPALWLCGSNERDTTAGPTWTEHDTRRTDEVSASDREGSTRPGAVSSKAEVGESSNSCGKWEVDGSGLGHVGSFSWESLFSDPWVGGRCSSEELFGFL